MKGFRLNVKKRGFLRNFFFCLLAFFLFLFPKGGVKFREVPITWGYLLMGLFAVLFTFRRRFVLHTARVRCFLLMIPFQILSLMTIVFNGAQNPGVIIAFIISFLFLPILFFLILSDSIELLSLNTLLRFLRMGLFFLAIYGIFLFFYRFLVGKWIEIPFLTINFHDMGQLDNKHISRDGSLFKLVSTYNNGNIYGICMLMLLPIYNLCEGNLFRKIIVKLSILLTLSRTVWLGLFFSELLYHFMVRKKSYRDQCKFLFIFTFLTGAIFYIIYQFDFSIAFVMDKTLGNRDNQLEYLITANLFSSAPFDGILEIVYLGILKNFGWIGLVTFLMGINGPVWIHFLKSYKRKITFFEKALRACLFTYLFLSLADGAILLIPTMVFYWFLSSLLQRKDFDYCIPGRRSVSMSPTSIKYCRPPITNCR